MHTREHFAHPDAPRAPGGVVPRAWSSADAPQGIPAPLAMPLAHKESLTNELLIINNKL